MTPYELGFDAGERQAFSDRKHDRRARQKPLGQMTAFARGWWDGYQPRSMTWWMTAHHKPPCVDDRNWAVEVSA